MKKVILLVIAIILITASQAIAQYKYRGSGNGVITSTDCSTYTAIGQLCQDTDDGILYKGTGSAVEVVYSSTSALSADIQALLGSADYATARTNMGTWGVSGSITDEQLVCGETTDGSNALKSCGAKVTDNSTSSHGIYKDASGYIANLPVAIDAHAASTTITLYPGICPVIHNAGQAAADINNALPSLAEGLCFIAQVRTAQAANYWRLTAATGNTVCLDGTCSKDYVSFAAPAVANFYTCIAAGTTAWHCESGRGTATTD
jgi:hypothetical protein